jgi:predicted transcriptional regulator
MKTKTISQLDDAEYSKITILQQLGISRIDAKTIMYLIASEPSSEKDITAGTGLPQPQVSTATRHLIDRGWVEREAVQTGAGRPGYRYSAKVDLARIAEELRLRNAERQAEIMRMFDELVKE